MANKYTRDDNSEENKDLKFLFKKAETVDKLTKEEEYELITKIQKGSPEQRDKAMNIIVQRNLKLVVKTAKNFTNQGIPLVDLVQEGCTGVMRAAEKFDMTTGYKFSTYASPWIRQRMGRAISRGGRLIKISETVLKDCTDLKRTYRKMVEEEGISPTSSELAEELGITRDKAEELGRMLNDLESLDKPFGEDENLTLVDYLEDEVYSPEEKTESTIDKEYVSSLLQFLSREDANFIKLKYGFIDHEPRTDRSMSILLKIPIKEVKEREERILLELRKKASVFDINMSISCSLVITGIPGDSYNDVVYCIWNLLNLDFTRIRVMINHLPATIHSNLNQHIAQTYKEKLEAAGASVDIIPNK